MLEWLGKLRRPHPRPLHGPTRTLDVALHPGSDATWSPATIVSGRPMIQLAAELTVVNTSQHRVILASAKLRKPATEGLVRLHDGDRKTSGTFPLEPSARARASVYFFILLSPLSAATNVVGDIGLVDQFGNTHWLEKVRFRRGDPRWGDEKSPRVR